MIRAKKNQQTTGVRSGFTIIELMLAMTFVSVLLLAIALTIIRAGTIYSKGMALRDINQSSRAITEDLRRTVTSAGSISLSSTNYVVSRVGGGTTGPVLSGRLCLGNYSYLWNTLDGAKATTNIKNNGTAVSLVRVPDAGRFYCANVPGVGLPWSIRSTDREKLVQLVKEGDHKLSLTAFSVDTGSSLYDPVTGQRLFTVNYSIGTGEPSTMTADRTACLPPSDPASDPVYCNVQQFSSVVRAGGGA